MRVGFNKIENRKTERITETRNCFFKNLISLSADKFDTLLARVTERRQKSPMKAVNQRPSV